MITEKDAQAVKYAHRALQEAVVALAEKEPGMHDRVVRECHKARNLLKSLSF